MVNAKSRNFCPYCGSDDMRMAGFSSGYMPKQRYKCQKCGRKTIAPRHDAVPMRDRVPKAQRYIITAAQNATPIHKGFWLALLNAVKYYNAELVVIPGRYRNPTSIWTQKNMEHEWWASEVMPYLLQGRVDLNSRLMILGDVKIQWAARSPLSSMDTMTGDKSGIVGHGNRALRSIASPQHRYPKIMFTTGACTVENYTDTKRGAIAEFNHCVGALIVELDNTQGNGAFYARQLNAAKDGSFTDLDVEFTADAVRAAPPALSLVMGDTHQQWISSGVADATFNSKNGMVKMLAPEVLVWHDLLDQYARSHHHKDDWLINFGKWKHGLDSVREEIERAVRFVNKITSPSSRSVIVSSNHDRALERWLKEIDFRNDPKNAEFYLETALAVVKSVQMYDGGIQYDDPFAVYGRKIAKSNVRFLKSRESCMIGGVEHSLHGDLGPNGSRGTTRNLSTIGTKVTKGHSHTAEIVDGCYSVGKSTGHLGYEGGGPSSHSQAHVVLYANGKRSILFIINGKFCLPRPPKPRKRKVS